MLTRNLNSYAYAYKFNIICCGHKHFLSNEEASGKHYFGKRCVPSFVIIVLFVHTWMVTQVVTIPKLEPITAKDLGKTSMS